MVIRALSLRIDLVAVAQLSRLFSCSSEGSDEAEGSDEVGERCAAVIRTSLGYCTRCAQSAAGESTPNPKVQHVHYDTDPRATGNRRACGCCGAPARQRPVRRISRNIAHPGRTENSTPGPMSVLPRQLAGRLGVSAAHRAVGNKHPKGIWNQTSATMLER